MAFEPRGGPICVAPELGRIFVMLDGMLTAFDLNTQQSLGSVLVGDPNVSGDPFVVRGPVRWGVDGLAYTDGSSVYVFRTTLASPQ